MHIPKTAGTSLHKIIEKQYPKRSIHTLYPGSTEQLEALRTSAEKGTFRVVIGHFQFGIHEWFPGAPRYITFFRDPVDQVISHYNHLINSDMPLHQEILGRNHSFESFLAHDWARNLQTSYLTHLSSSEVERDPDDAFRRALAVLEDHFLGFGIVEDFAKSVRLIASKLRWRVRFFPVVNRSVDRPRMIRRNELSKSLLERIVDANLCDMRLYEHVRSSLSTADGRKLIAHAG
jgi:hypothetical protein